MKAETNLEGLSPILSRWDRRSRLVKNLSWGVRGITAGLLATLLAAIASRLVPLFPVSGLIGLALVGSGIGLTIGTLVNWLWPRSLPERARYFDRVLGLKERLSTAVEIAGGKTGKDLPNWLTREQLTDAIQAAKDIPLAHAIPWRLPRRDWLSLLCVVMLLGTTLWFDNPMDEVLSSRMAVRESIQEQAEALEAIREEISVDPELREADREKLLEVLDNTVKQLEQRDLSAEEALAELNRASDQLGEMVLSDAASRVQTLARAGDAMGESGITASLGEALSSGDLKRAAAILQDLSDQAGERLTREQELELAKGLAQAASELSADDQDLKNALDVAAQAINDADYQAAKRSLTQASSLAGQTGEQIALSRAASSATEEIASNRPQIAQAGST